MWFDHHERTTLAMLGLLALAGLGVQGWQQHRPPLTVAATSPPAEGARWDGALTAARRVDVNAASVAELERLPGIGPALARRIVDDRAAHGPFRSIEELDRVPGIGPSTRKALNGYVLAGE